MTRKQIENVCRHFGLSEWTEHYVRLVTGGHQYDRDFHRLYQRGRGKRCLDMMKTILSEDVIRECFTGWRDFVPKLEEALAIANG